MKLAFRLAAYAAIFYGAYSQNWPVAAWGSLWLVLQRLDDVEQLAMALISVTPDFQKELAKHKAARDK